MNKWLKNSYVKWGLTAFVTMVATICFVYGLFFGASVIEAVNQFLQMIMPILFGFSIAYLLTPILNFIEGKLLKRVVQHPFFENMPRKDTMVRGVGILLTGLFVCLLAYLFFMMLLSQIVPSLTSIASNGSTYVDNVSVWVEEVVRKNPAFSGYVRDLLAQYSTEVTNWLNTNLLSRASEVLRILSLGILNTVSVLWKFIIGFIISLYVLGSKERFAAQSKKMTYALFQRETANAIIRHFRFAHRTFIGFLNGKIWDSVIIGILCFIGTSLLNIPYAALVSVIVGVTNVIPFFGPIIGAIPCTLLIFAIDPMNPLNSLYFVIFIFALQQFDGNILGPKILGDSTGLSSFWVIFAIMLFGGLYGVPGMIIGVPLFAIIYAGVKSVVQTALEKKHLRTETQDFLTLDYVDEDGQFHSMKK